MTSTIQLNHAWNKSFVPTGGAENVYLLLEMKGTGEVKSERAPINVSLVLDRSGSMQGEALEYSKKACQFVIDQMGEQDILSLVAFDDEIITVFEPQKVTHKAILKQKVDEIDTCGCTNLSGGLIQGAQYVKKEMKSGYVNRVILLSDGHANRGVTDALKLASIAEEYRNLGIGITTIGVGNGFDEELMEGIADAGGGNFYYVEKPDDIPSIFSKELDGLLSVVAQNINLTLKPSKTLQITNIFGYKAKALGNSAKTNEDSFVIHVGDLFNQEMKSILIEMAFFPHSVGSHSVLDLNWEYVDVTEGAKLCTIQNIINAEFTNDIQLLNEVHNVTVEKQVKITKSSLAIEEAMIAFDSGNIGKGKELLQQQADLLLASAIQSDDAELRIESEALYNQLENFTYSPKTRKTLHEQKYRQMKRKSR